MVIAVIIITCIVPRIYIAVGSIKENLDHVTSSSEGEELDIVAPGENILSTINYEDGASIKHDNDSGTSMAVPHISGILALYRENYPTFGPTLIENMLYVQATDLGEKGKDSEYGYGLPTAIPPKYYTINKEIVVNTFSHIYQFPNNELSPYREMAGVYKAIRAKGWNEDKKRFEWYYLSENNDEINGIGWMKLDDSFNNKEIDRETINFTDTNLILYNSPNFDSYDKTIEINPKRIRTHVSEDKITDAITGKTEWFKINLPEYSIENKWIYIPAYKQNLTSEYREIKFEMSVQENSLVFYDDPELLTNPTTSNVVQNKLAYVSEGYEWVDYKTGYRWYKVSIPELGIENKWINTGDYHQWGSIHQYGLMDKLSGRSIEEKDITSFQLLKTNNNGDVKIKPQGNVTYRFDNAALVKQAFVKNYYNESVKNLKIEFYNKSNEIIYSKDIKNEDINSRHLHLNFETEIPNVYYYKLINTSETDLYLTSFDIFGDFDISAIPPKKINFEQSFFSNSYTFYDEPELKTNPQIVGALQDKRTII
jgi:hypothetical protein